MDYAKAYRLLFNAISRVIDLLECPEGASIPDSLDILKDAQLTTEDMYMQGRGLAFSRARFGLEE